VNPAAQYADARRTALALIRAIKQGDMGRVDVVTSNLSAGELGRAAVIAAGMAAPFYTEDEVDQHLARTVMDEATGEYDRMVQENLD
jgi:hypothetical protein